MSGPDWRALLAEILAADKRFDEHVAGCDDDPECEQCAIHGEQFQSALLAAHHAFIEEAADAAARKREKLF